MIDLQKLFRRPIGIFSDVFHGSERERAEAIAAHGFSCVQWRLPLATQDINATNVKSLLKPYQDNGLQIVALAGYENIVEPNGQLRVQNLERLKRLMDIAPLCGRGNLGGGIGVATETGTKNRMSQWQWHDDNASEATWAELKNAITELSRYAKQTGSRLLLEGYIHNVLRTADHIDRLRRELRSVEYWFVMDPFNLFMEDKVAQQQHELSRIFTLMGKRVAIAHAKDLVYYHGQINTPRAGQGILDYKTYFRLLDEHLPDVPLILEHLTAEQIEDTVEFLIRSKSLSQ
jgi:sugar phosphate isomerase/epimerase